MDYQRLVFDWASHESGWTGLVILVAGLIYGFCGLRLIRGLVVIPAAGLGMIMGLGIAKHFGISMLPPVVGCGLLGAVLGLCSCRGAIITVSAVVWAGLAAYLCMRFDLPDLAMLIIVGVFGVGAAVLTIVSRPSMTVMATTLLGAAMIIVGFVGVSSSVAPGLSVTFRGMAARYAVVVPILMLMVCVTAYSFQASYRRGDLITGTLTDPKT